MPEWLNTPDPYIQYCHFSDCPRKMQQILLSYGQFFDDTYTYWVARRNPDIIRRRPLWMTQKGMPIEKHHSYRKGKQLKLCASLLACGCGQRKTRHKP